MTASHSYNNARTLAARASRIWRIISPLLGAGMLLKYTYASLVLSSAPWSSAGDACGVSVRIVRIAVIVRHATRGRQPASRTTAG